MLETNVRAWRDVKSGAKVRREYLAKPLYPNFFEVEK